jgi:hypothetical protein|eukprot:COSAG06_NODE_6218_length_3043_cov_8.938256_3_plen_100_part_00
MLRRCSTPRSSSPSATSVLRLRASAPLRLPQLTDMALSVCWRAQSLYGVLRIFYHYDTFVGCAPPLQVGAASRNTFQLIRSGCVGRADGPGPCTLRRSR